MSLIDCSKLEVNRCELGVGVFAKVNIKKGTDIEHGLMQPLVGACGELNPHLHYWGDDQKTWACSSGCLAYYNHSDKPNAKKFGDLKHNTIIVKALVDIKKGDEIRTRYMSKSWRKCFSHF